jgi:hypothetical protein
LPGKIGFCPAWGHFIYKISVFSVPLCASVVRKSSPRS